MYLKTKGYTHTSDICIFQNYHHLRINTALASTGWSCFRDPPYPLHACLNQYQHDQRPSRIQSYTFRAKTFWGSLEVLNTYFSDWGQKWLYEGMITQPQSAVDHSIHCHCWPGQVTQANLHIVVQLLHAGHRASSYNMYKRHMHNINR